MKLLLRKKSHITFVLKTNAYSQDLRIKRIILTFEDYKKHGHNRLK